MRMKARLEITPNMDVLMVHTNVGRPIIRQLRAKSSMVFFIVSTRKSMSRAK
ncbi:hypothetical protein DPMN_114567 [Dreissena polymorpha]|uniref:Uncharacterized protein n=1 Tax=Dreissena polymorpha TaxID=45954 RepID=A0A9D4QSZ0_DREPO|nr:hypothetical protein DPMN_114567 [Dreissena polymorpha]